MPRKKAHTSFEKRQRERKKERKRAEKLEERLRRREEKKAAQAGDGKEASGQERRDDEAQEAP